MELEAAEFERKKKEREALKNQMMDMKNKSTQRKSVVDELNDVSSDSDDDILAELGSDSSDSSRDSEGMTASNPFVHLQLLLLLLSILKTTKRSKRSTRNTTKS